MTNEVLKTVTIIQDKQEVRINECDYDAEVHQLAGEKEPKAVETEGTLSDMSFDELKDKAEELGVDTKGLRSKAAYAEAIDAFEAAKKKAEYLIVPTAEGSFQIINEKGESLDGVVYETQEEAEKALLGE